MSSSSSEDSTALPTPSQRARIDALLSGNAAPSDTDRANLSELKAQGLAHIAALETRIVEMEAALEALVAEQSTTQAWVSQMTAVLHPIRTVPLEVLSEIFIQAVEVPADPALWTESLVLTRPQWVASHVSLLWRQAALSTPILWNNLAFTFIETNGTALLKSYLLDLYLSRSGERPIRVSIKAQDHKLSSRHTFSTLVRSIPRWQKCYMEMSSVALANFNLSPCAPTSLEAVVLRTETETTTYPVTLFKRAPRIHSFTYKGSLRALNKLRFPLGKLVHYQASTMGNISLQFTAQASPNLKSVDVWMSYATPDAPSSWSHPTLSALTLRGCTLASSQLLAAVDLPCLQTLHLECEAIAKEFNHVNIRGLYTMLDPLRPAVGSNISTLILTVASGRGAAHMGTGTGTGPDERARLAAFLASTPAVRDLTVRIIKRSEIDGVLACLDTGLAALTRLEILGMKGITSVTHDLISTIGKRRAGSRSGGIAELREVVISGIMSCDDGVEGLFAELCSLGLSGKLRRRI